jgi:hypothetical protein
MGFAQIATAILWPGFARPAGDADRAPLWRIKLEMEKTLDGCPEHAHDEVAACIAHCATARDLWMLRAGIFQAISIVSGEASARSRINGLLPFFVRWIPERQRVAI